MFRYVMLCYVRYVMLCYVMLLCCVMLLCYVMLCYVMSATVSCARPNFYSCFHLLQIREADWLSGAVYQLLDAVCPGEVKFLFFSFPKFVFFPFFLFVNKSKTNMFTFPIAITQLSTKTDYSSAFPMSDSQLGCARKST